MSARKPGGPAPAAPAAPGRPRQPRLLLWKGGREVRAVIQGREVRIVAPNDRVAEALGRAARAKGKGRAEPGSAPS